MKHVTIEYAVTENRRVELDLTDSFDASNYEKDALLEEIYRKEDLGNYNCLDYQAYSISGIYFDTPSASVEDAEFSMDDKSWYDAFFEEGLDSLPPDDRFIEV